MSQPWRHHFVAQMHLRGFADAGGLLYYFDKTRPQDAIRHESPKAIFFRKHLYSCGDPETGAMDAELETYFAQQVEDTAARVIRKIVEAARARKLPGLSPNEVEIWRRYWYFQHKRVPDVIDPMTLELEEKLLSGVFPGASGDREMTAAEKALFASPEERSRILRDARVDAQSAQPAPFVADAMSSRGMLIAVIGDPRKALVVGSNPTVVLRPPGLTNSNNRGVEIWFPISSDVAISPGGPPGSERLVVVNDHAIVRRINELIVDQSRQFAGRSEKLIASLAHGRR